MSEFRLMIVALPLVTILAILGQGKTWPLKTKAVLPGTALFPRLSTSYGWMRVSIPRRPDRQAAGNSHSSIKAGARLVLRILKSPVSWET